MACFRIKMAFPFPLLGSLTDAVGRVEEAKGDQCNRNQRLTKEKKPVLKFCFILF